MQKTYCDVCGNESRFNESIVFHADEPEVNQWIGDVCIECQIKMRRSVGIDDHRSKG